MATQPLTIRTKSEKLELIDAIGRATDRSRNYIINAAIDRYLEDEAAFVEAVRAGQADAATGKTASHDAVFDRLRSRINAQNRSA